MVYAEIVTTGSPGAAGTFGYPDIPNWAPLDGNAGRPGTDFSQFEAFQRGVVIFGVLYANLPGENPATLTGYVASIPVGLNMVVLADGVEADARVTKGVTELGRFYYCGSLNILLLSVGMIDPAIQTRWATRLRSSRSARRRRRRGRRTETLSLRSGTAWGRCGEVGCFRPRHEAIRVDSGDPAVGNIFE